MNRFRLFSSRCGSFALGVYDKASYKVTLVPVQTGRILRMEPRVRGLDYAPNKASAAEEREDGAAGAEEAADARAARNAATIRLVDAFGSTRRKRQLTAREDGVVRTHKLTSPDALQKLASQTKADAADAGLTRAEVDARAAGFRNVPPHDPDATTFQQAYTLEGLVPPAGRDGLSQSQNALLALVRDEAKLAAARDAGRVPAYVLGRLHLLQTSDSALARRRAAPLALLATLLQLRAARDVLSVPVTGGISDLARQVHVRPEVLEVLLDLFYHPSQEGDRLRYERPSQKKELLTGYLLVAAMMVEDGGILHATQFEELRQELKMSAADLLKRFRELGAVGQQATVKAEDSSAGELRIVNRASYTVSVLKDNFGAEPKTLRECFPQLKTGARARGR